MKPVQHTGYDLMPASVDTFGTYESMGVRFEKNPKSKWMTKSFKDGVHSYYYPDRTIFRMRPGAQFTSIPDVAFDQYLDYAVLSNPELYKNMGYRYVMISPPHMGFRKAAIRNPHLNVFADSGGFQLRMGVKDWIDPDQLVDFYNASTDIGIGLDVPMDPALYPQYLARMAHVTSRNGQYIKSKLGPQARLWDLNHGMNLDDRKVFLDVTEQYEPNDGLALAGTASTARGDYGVAAHIVNGVVGISYVLDRSKKRYRTAHILGTTTPFYMFVFHLMTKSGFFPHITSDSSTYAQSAIMNTQMTSVPGQSILYRNTMPKGKVLYRSPCTCPACSMVGYTHHLVVNARANMVHALHHFAYMNGLIEDLADHWLEGTMKPHEIEKIVSPPQFHHKHFRGTMNFLSDLFEMGFAKARKKNEDFIEPMLGRKKQKSLFGLADKPKLIAGELKPWQDAKRNDAILTRYETWLSERGIKQAGKGAKK